MLDPGCLSSDDDDEADEVLGDVTVRSNVTMRYGKRADVFKGAVDSLRPGCERGRTVKLFKKRAGADRRLGKDETNRRGKWRIGDFPNPRGRYYAKVVKKTFTSPAGTTVLCTAAVSDVLRMRRR